MIPPYIARKASAVAERLQKGEIRPRRLLLTRKKWQVVDLSKRWRMVSTDGVDWQVISHECYSKLTSMHRNTTA